MTISLPIPNAALWPNSRKHWRAKAKFTKDHRQAAHDATELKPEGYFFTEFSGYTLAFFYPDKRRRDDDNAQASCKAYRDGIADALGVDDNTLRLLEIPTFAIDRENPRVEITLKSLTK